VIDSLYRYTRNPMYVGVLLAVTGHVLWFGSPWLTGYALLLWLIIHVFVTTYEEPHLRKTFGRAYQQYCQKVPRWFFRY
jgi:protein-S-isoprenylcysteine O-methyltransferase Ste14